MSVVLAAAILVGVASDPYVQDGYNPPEVKTSKVEASPTTTIAPAPLEQATHQGMGNRTSDVEQWRPLVNGHFEPEDVDRILCLISHESGGNPAARNPSSGTSGLLQIMPFWADEYGVSKADLFTPEINLFIGRKIRDSQGWTAWAPYNRGLCR